MNAALHLPLEAGATQERRLEAVRCKRLLAGRACRSLPSRAQITPHRHGQQTAPHSASLLRQGAHRRLEQRLDATPQTVRHERVDEPPQRSV